ncbi:MAG: hypothetical protein KTR16_12665 [Acidiferrobacterales bacterium]|nr:hypothetical protein [Acidiferrobacterales bacterium]
MIKELQELIAVMANNKIHIETESLMDGTGRVKTDFYIDGEIVLSTTEMFIDVSDLYESCRDLGRADLEKAKKGCGKVDSSGGWTTFCGEQMMGESVWRCKPCEDIIKKYERAK